MQVSGAFINIIRLNSTTSVQGNRRGHLTSFIYLCKALRSFTVFFGVLFFSGSQILLPCDPMFFLLDTLTPLGFNILQAPVLLLFISIRPEPILYLTEERPVLQTKRLYSR